MKNLIQWVATTMLVLGAMAASKVAELMAIEHIGDTTNIVLSWDRGHVISSPSNTFSVLWPVPQPRSPAKRILLTVVNTNSEAAYFSTNGVNMERDDQHPADPFWKNRVFLLSARSTNQFDIRWDGARVAVYSGQVVAFTTFTSQTQTNEIQDLALKIESVLSTNWLPMNIERSNLDGTTRQEAKEIGIVLSNRYANVYADGATNRILLSSQAMLPEKLLIRNKQAGWVLFGQPTNRFLQWPHGQIITNNHYQ